MSKFVDGTLDEMFCKFIVNLKVGLILWICVDNFRGFVVEEEMGFKFFCSELIYVFVVIRRRRYRLCWNILCMFLVLFRLRSVWSINSFVFLGTLSLMDWVGGGLGVKFFFLKVVVFFKIFIYRFLFFVIRIKVLFFRLKRLNFIVVIVFGILIVLTRYFFL